MQNAANARASSKLGIPVNVGAIKEGETMTLLPKEEEGRGSDGEMVLNLSSHSMGGKTLQIVLRRL